MIKFSCKIFLIAFLTLAGIPAIAQNRSFEFYDGTFNFELNQSSNVKFEGILSKKSVADFYIAMESGEHEPLVNKLLDYKEKHELNDWIYYQLIRKTAQQISPKAENYNRYTLYKWFLLAKSGYDARLGIANDRLIFYVRNNENINDIPFFIEGGNKYMCLNIHDYGYPDLSNEPMIPIATNVPGASNSFSYKVTRMPDFKPDTYTQKELKFDYDQKSYHFQLKLNPAVEGMFANYPGVDFETYFNIPLSKETHGSLIPLLTKNVEGMSQKKGIDYLMRFTRYAFLYENDDDNFGREKRLSPEQTLLSSYSDCDDRAALFFYLVREIYDLPMIALLYPTHITMAVRFDKPVGASITYKGQKYSVCEATPQSEDLRIGQISSNLRKAPYSVVYQYDPLVQRAN
ncbi:hypothetical protein [Daejeonella lutea]|uniref:Transglutaminase-like superfamily protein n=1 Tax=Daejeonella lutea TaxID=572036 RepID=A0A1T4ZYT1_9SPHI|nr:hypothetical protein [Daejeonella lutea]SKB27846.1 hypothetical protein SAMN05661099_0095 [Daejeonella lutea]